VTTPTLAALEAAQSQTAYAARTLADAAVQALRLGSFVAHGETLGEAMSDYLDARARETECRAAVRSSQTGAAA
jgi:hypothetical protein